MLALIALAVVLLVLIAGVGTPYSQSWHQRFGENQR